MLYILGGVTFDVVPTNLQDVRRERGFDWVAKEIVGAQRPFEGMGISDAPVSFKGKLFPERFGMGALEELAAMAEAGAPQMLIRGDGDVLGWHCLRWIRETHSYLGANGVGKVIEIEMDLVQSPTGPTADAMMAILQGLF